MSYALKNSIAYRFIRAANSVNKTLNNKLSPYDIAIEQRATLEIIKFEPNVNQTMIANLLGKDKTTISRSLNSLEKKGLISKSEITGDKRSNKVELTKEGEIILDETIDEVTSYRESLNS
ncbi:MAG: MarR family winged helix-turn-helix transcriptional regulator, partial [Halarcobacter sp.]